jgi:hypothetical protein
MRSRTARRSRARLAERPSVLADLELFTALHHPHGSLTAEEGRATANGHRLEVRCPCGLVFERWLTAEECGGHVEVLARSPRADRL